MLELITKQFEENIFGLGGFILGILSLFLHWKNRIIQKKSYYISRGTKRRNEVEFIRISTKQIGDNHITKLIVFNPNSQGLILQALKTYKKKTTYPFLQNLGLISKWIKIDSVWWPSESSGENEDPKLLKDGYNDLFVKDYKTVFVSIKGNIDTNQYKFELISSHDKNCHITTINSYDSQFPINYKRYYTE